MLDRVIGDFLVLVAALASLVAAGLYIREMFRGKAKPNKVSWLMWSISPFIVTGVAVYTGVTWAAIPVFMIGFAPFLIFMASLFTKKAFWKLNNFDYLCGGLSASALVLWVVTMEPILSIALAIMSDVIASIPTLTKVWSKPETESVWPFITGTLNSVASLMVAVSWSFSEISFPIYQLLINPLFVFMVVRRKLKSTY